MSRTKLTVIRLLDLGMTDAWRTQAVYHAVAELMREDSPDTIIFCRPRTPYVCLGYHQVYDATFDRAELERRGLPVFRRRLGGGATYLDSNQLFYQCIVHHSRAPVMLKDVYQRMLAAPVAALRRVGLDAQLYDLNEIEVGGKRIAGIGGGRIDEAAVVVGNVLCAFDYASMAAVWRVPSESFRALALETMRQRIATLREFGQFEFDTLERLLAEEFSNAFRRPLEEGKLSSEEERRSIAIARRMASPEYLNLHNDSQSSRPMRTLKVSARAWIHATEAQLDRHSVRASFRVLDNFIEEARLESSPARNWDGVERGLQGVSVHDWEERTRSLMHGAREVCPAV
jgi:lipoate-protein ligase A